MSHEYTIDMYADHETLKSQVDFFWNFIYTNEEITNVRADDDGKIFYTAPHIVIAEWRITP